MLVKSICKDLTTLVICVLQRTLALVTAVLNYKVGKIRYQIYFFERSFFLWKSWAKRFRSKKKRMLKTGAFNWKLSIFRAEQFGV